MLFLLAILFAMLCCFTFWLRTGVYWPFASERYSQLMSQSFQATGDDRISLSDSLSAPIDVKKIPIHGIIMGLIFASLSSIPILVAILYRVHFSIIFAAMVMFLAAMPWLGITVLGGCVLASVRPFRMSFRYASAVLGLIPVAIYFVLASWDPANQQASFRPLTLIYAPWVLALLGSCVICALALAIASLINYRPGGIPPLLAMLFAIPVFLFYTHVGIDELNYCLLKQEIGPGSRTTFASLDVGARADQAATRHWSKARNESYDQIQRRMLRRETDRVVHGAEDDRVRAVRRCDLFIKRFPQSDRVPLVYYLRGRAQDMRIQQRKLIEDQVAEFRAAIPGGISRRTWETLITHFPDNELSAIALRKLAIFQGREGRAEEAIATLETLLQRFDPTRTTTQPRTSPPTDTVNIMPEAPVSTGLGVDLTIEVSQARWMKEMLQACKNDPAKPYSEVLGPSPGSPDALVKPYQLLLQLDPGDSHYKANLEGLARVFAGSETSGYIEIRLALLERAISRRLQRFGNAAVTLEGKAAQAEAMFYLADTLQEDTRFNDARLEFEKLIQTHPESCWAHESQTRLSSLSLMETRTPDE